MQSHPLCIRVDNNPGFRMCCLYLDNMFCQNPMMGRTISFPKYHGSVQFGRYIASQAFIRDKEYFMFFGNRRDDFHCIGRSTTYIALCFYSSRAIYITNNFGIRMFFFFILSCLRVIIFAIGQPACSSGNNTSLSGRVLKRFLP